MTRDPYRYDPPGHADGLWMCSSKGMELEQHETSRKPAVLVCACVLLPLAIAAVVWAVRFLLQH